MRRQLQRNSLITKVRHVVERAFGSQAQTGPMPNTALSRLGLSVCLVQATRVVVLLENIPQTLRRSPNNYANIEICILLARMSGIYNDYSWFIHRKSAKKYLETFR